MCRIGRARRSFLFNLEQSNEENIIFAFLCSSFFPHGSGATVLTLDSSELQAAGGSYTLTEGINSGYGNFSVTMALDAQAFQDAILAGNVKANIFFRQ